MVFDPTNFDLVNVIPNCSQINVIQSFFRSFWFKIESVICDSIKECHQLGDKQAIIEFLDSFVEQELSQKDFSLSFNFGTNGSNLSI